MRGIVTCVIEIVRGKASEIEMRGDAIGKPVREGTVREKAGEVMKGITAEVGTGCLMKGTGGKCENKIDLDF